MSDNKSNVSKLLSLELTRVNGDNLKLREEVTTLKAQTQILSQIMRDVLMAAGNKARRMSHLTAISAASINGKKKRHASYSDRDDDSNSDYSFSSSDDEEGDTASMSDESLRYSSSTASHAYDDDNQNGDAGVEVEQGDVGTGNPDFGKPMENEDLSRMNKGRMKRRKFGDVSAEVN